MQKEIGPKTGQETSYTMALRGPSRRTATYSAGPKMRATYNMAQAGIKDPSLSLKRAPGGMGCGWRSQMRLFKAITAY